MLDILNAASRPDVVPANAPRPGIREHGAPPTGPERAVEYRRLGTLAHELLRNCGDLRRLDRIVRATETQLGLQALDDKARIHVCQPLQRVVPRLVDTGRVAQSAAARRAFRTPPCWAIGAGPDLLFDGGRLLWESAGKRFNGDFLKFGSNDPEYP